MDLKTHSPCCNFFEIDDDARRMLLQGPRMQAHCSERLLRRGCKASEATAAGLHQAFAVPGRLGPVQASVTERPSMHGSHEPDSRLSQSASAAPMMGHSNLHGTSPTAASPQRQGRQGDSLPGRLFCNALMSVGAYHRPSRQGHVHAQHPDFHDALASWLIRLAQRPA